MAPKNRKRKRENLDEIDGNASAAGSGLQLFSFQPAAGKKQEKLFSKTFSLPNSVACIKIEDYNKRPSIVFKKQSFWVPFNEPEFRQMIGNSKFLLKMVRKCKRKLVNKYGSDNVNVEDDEVVNLPSKIHHDNNVKKEKGVISYIFHLKVF